jgi:hypothetical protein
LPSSLRALPEPVMPATRLSRAALYALRIGTLSVTSVTTVACGGTRSTGGTEKDSGQTDSASIGDAAYGGPPPNEAGEMDDASQVAAIYGAFMPNDGSVSFFPDANYAVPYGLPAPPPPVDAGASDAADDRSDIVHYPPPPPYGGPPPFDDEPPADPDAPKAPAKSR